MTLILCSVGKYDAHLSVDSRLSVRGRTVSDTAAKLIQLSYPEWQGAVAIPELGELDRTQLQVSLLSGFGG